MLNVTTNSNRPVLASTGEWIQKHTPKLSTVGLVALQAIALTGIAAAAVYFPIPTMAIGIGGFIAFRFYTEYVQQKFDESFANEVDTATQSYNAEHSRMLKSVKMMKAVARNRRMAQFVAIAAAATFWNISAPLVLVVAGIAGCTLALDYFDSKSSLKKLKKQVRVRIYNNPSLNASEKNRVRELYPLDDDIQIRQKLEIERDCRFIKLKFQNRVDKYIADAYDYILRQGVHKPEDGAQDPELIIKLGQLSVVYELESSDDNSKFKRSPILRARLNEIENLRVRYFSLTTDRRKALKQRIVSPEGYTRGSEMEEQVFREVCEHWSRDLTEKPFILGAEKFYLRKFKLLAYIKSVVSNAVSMVHSPGTPRSF